MESLQEYKSDYIKIIKKARIYRGKKFLIPLKLLDNPYAEGKATCTIDDVHVYESCVEVTYSDGSNDDLWTTIDFKLVDDHAEWIS